MSLELAMEVFRVKCWCFSFFWLSNSDSTNWRDFGVHVLKLQRNWAAEPISISCYRSLNPILTFSHWICICLIEYVYVYVLFRKSSEARTGGICPTCSTTTTVHYSNLAVSCFGCCIIWIWTYFLCSVSSNVFGNLFFPRWNLFYVQLSNCIDA